MNEADALGQPSLSPQPCLSQPTVAKVVHTRICFPRSHTGGGISLSSDRMSPLIWLTGSLDLFANFPSSRLEDQKGLDYEQAASGPCALGALTWELVLRKPARAAELAGDKSGLEKEDSLRKTEPTMAKGLGQVAVQEMTRVSPGPLGPLREQTLQEETKLLELLTGRRLPAASPTGWEPVRHLRWLVAGGTQEGSLVLTPC